MAHRSNIKENLTFVKILMASTIYEMMILNAEYVHFEQMRYDLAKVISHNSWVIYGISYNLMN